MLFSLCVNTLPAPSPSQRTDNLGWLARKFVESLPLWNKYRYLLRRAGLAWCLQEKPRENRSSSTSSKLIAERPVSVLGFRCPPHRYTINHAYCRTYESRALSGLTVVGTTQILSALFWHLCYCCSMIYPYWFGGFLPTSYETTVGKTEGTDGCWRHLQPEGVAVRNSPKWAGVRSTSAYQSLVPW